MNEGAFSPPFLAQFLRREEKMRRKKELSGKSKRGLRIKSPLVEMSLLGIVFGLVLAFIISQFAGWAVGWSFKAIFLSVGVCAVVGLIFGLYPATKASRLDPIEALRHD